jgi:hypothetical protein
MPGSRANIVPSGVLVIDTKRLKGKIEVRRPFFGDEQLLVSGRDKTKLVEGLRRQVAAYEAGELPDAAPIDAAGRWSFKDPRRTDDRRDVRRLRPGRRQGQLGRTGASSPSPRRIVGRCVEGPGDRLDTRITFALEPYLMSLRVSRRSRGVPLPRGRLPHPGGDAREPGQAGFGAPEGRL